MEHGGGSFTAFLVVDVWVVLVQRSSQLSTCASGMMMMSDDDGVLMIKLIIVNYVCGGDVQGFCIFLACQSRKRS
jgi:hypothetical protein